MCPRTHRVQLGKWENRMMKLETFKKIIDEGVKKGLKAINLNNFGESFFNKNLVKMIEYAKSKGVLDVMCHTNEQLWTKSLQSKLLILG